MQMKGLVHCLNHSKHSTGCLVSSADSITDYLCTPRQVSSCLWVSVSSLVDSTSLIGPLNGQWNHTYKAFRVIPGTKQELKNVHSYYYNSNFNPSLYPTFSLQMEEFKISERGFPGGAVVKNCLPMEGTWVWDMVWEEPTCRGATKPVRHNYWACALEPVSHNYWAREPQLLKPVCLEPMLHNRRSHCNEKPAHRNKE